MGITARKRFASAGGRHELVAFGIDLSLDSGLNASRYDDLEDRMVQTSARITSAELDAATGSQGLPAGAAAAIVMLSDLDRGSWKYRGPAGFRTSLINVGFAGQLLLMNASALGLQIRMTDSLDQDLLAGLLGVDSSLAPILAFTVSGA